MSVRVPAVKICGVCRVEDAHLAVDAGADFVGVIVAGPGPRSQTLAQAAALLAAVPADRRVGVFVNAAVDAVVAAAEALSLAVVQLHGDEPVDAVRRIRVATAARVWKALRPTDGADLARFARDYAGAADALLLDGGGGGAYGGSGRRFDWAAVAAARGVLGTTPLVVAGGLDAASVGDAVRVLRPAVVDVSSGVEAAVGRKAPDKVRAFVAAVRRAAAELEPRSAS